MVSVAQMSFVTYDSMTGRCLGFDASGLNSLISCGTVKRIDHVAGISKHSHFWPYDGKKTIDEKAEDRSLP